MVRARLLRGLLRTNFYFLHHTVASCSQHFATATHARNWRLATEKFEVAAPFKTII